MQSKIAATALALSRQIQENSRLDYSSLFSPVLAEVYPKDRVASILTKLYSEHGAFKNLIPVKEIGGAEYFKVELVDGTSSDLILGSDETGLIDRFFLGGSLPGSRAVLVQERMMRTRDGTNLRTIIFQNNDGHPKAVVLERSPYLHFIHGHTPEALLYQNVARQFVEDGFAFVLQAVRGTGGSESEFKFLHPIEIDDGYDAVMWAAAQDFSNGKVGLVGGSYDGFTAIAAASSNPPPLKVVVASSYFTNMSNFGGLKGPIELFQLRWLDRVTRSQGTPSHFAPFSQEKVKLIENIPDIRTYDQKIYGVTIPEWQRLANAASSLANAYWNERSVLDRVGGITVPTFHLAGLNGDGNAIDTLNAFQRIQRESSFKNDHHLVLGYWGHPATPQMYPAIQAMAKKWFAHYLLDEPLENAPAVRFAAIQRKESEEFLVSDTFPLPRWKQCRLYLGDSRLDRVVSAENKDYVISVGGSQSVCELLDDKPLPKGTDRALQFTTIFESAATLVGVLKVKLFVSVQPAQADLVAVLRKKSNGSYATLGVTALKLLKSTQPSEVELVLGPLFESFAMGDELEILLAGDAFPTLARNTLAAPDKYFESFEMGEIRIGSSPEFPSQISFYLNE